MHWDPELRLTPEEALSHDWIHEGFNLTQPIYNQHRLLNSQYQSSPDIESTKLILKDPHYNLFPFDVNIAEIDEHTLSVRAKEM